MNDEMIVTNTFDAFKMYLPGEGKIKASRIAEAKELLWMKGLLCEDDLGRTWFHDKEKGHENDAFAGLKNIFDALANCKFDNQTTVVEYGSMPNRQTHSDIAGGSHQIDGYLALRQPALVAGDKLHTANIGVNFEFKLGDSMVDIVDNRRKVVSAATFMMNNDARRTHVYSISVENRRLSVWYFSRSHSAKSTVIDMTKNFDDVLAVFLSLLYADRKELGYDPFVHRLVDSTRKPTSDKHYPIVFVYEIDRRYFKTVRALADYTSWCVTGRAPRIWEVLEVVDTRTLVPLPGSKTMVLKDYWLDVGTFTEGEIHGKILADLSAVAAIIHPPQPTNDTTPPSLSSSTEHAESAMSSSILKPSTSSQSSTISTPPGNAVDGARPAAESTPSQFTVAERDDIMKCVNAFHPLDREALKATLRSSDAYKKHFLSIVCEQVGIQSKSATRDSFRVSEFFTEPEKRKSKATVSGADLSRSAVTAGVGGKPEIPEVLTRAFTPKHRCFIVYQEVGNTLHNLKKLSDVVKTISDCLRASQLLLLAGWVHRDISGGNLLLYEERGILSDLEYARRYTTTFDPDQDPKTGTPYIMATEIFTNRVLQPLEQEIDPSEIYEINYTAEEPAHGMESTKLREARSAGPVHNYAHDAESFWWLILWFVTARVEHQDSIKYASNIFKNTVMAPNERVSTFTEYGPNFVANLAAAIHEDLVTVPQVLNYARRLLLSAHRNRAGNLKELSYTTKASYTGDFIGMRTLVDHLKDVLSKLDPSSIFNQLKTYVDEEPWVDDHRHAPQRLRMKNLRKRAQSTSAGGSQPTTNKFARTTRSQTARAAQVLVDGLVEPASSAPATVAVVQTQSQAESSTPGADAQTRIPGGLAADGIAQAQVGPSTGCIPDISGLNIQVPTRAPTPANIPPILADLPPASITRLSK